MSHKEPVAYMDSLTIDLTEAIVRLLSDEAVESEAVEVSRVRGPVSSTASVCIPAEEIRPQKRFTFVQIGAVSFFWSAQEQSVLNLDEVLRCSERKKKHPPRSSSDNYHNHAKQRTRK